MYLIIDNKIIRFLCIELELQLVAEANLQSLFKCK